MVLWQAVGFQGVYELDQASSTWSTDATRAMEDRGDNNTTYFTGDIASRNNYYTGVNNSKKYDLYNQHHTI